MTAAVEIRFSPDMRNFYGRLIGEGKVRPVALPTVVRKPVMFANVLVRDNRE